MNSGTGSLGGAGTAARPARPALDFHLQTLNQSDAEWLTLGKKEGQLFDGDVEVRGSSGARTAARFVVFLSFLMLDLVSHFA